MRSRSASIAFCACSARTNLTNPPGQGPSGFKGFTERIGPNFLNDSFSIVASTPNGMFFTYTFESSFGDSSNFFARFFFALVAPPSFVHSPFAPGRFQDIAIELTPALDEQLEALLEPVHAHVHAHRVALFGAAAADKSRAQIVAERFSASVRRDGAGPPKLRVALLETRPPTIETRTLVDGTSWTPARPGSVDDLVPGAAVLPVVALQGGVWVVNGKFGFKWRLVACTVLTNKRRAARAAPISGEGAMVEVEVEVADPPTTPSASA